MVTASASAAPRARFTRASAFQDDLKRRVDLYFERTGRARTGGWHMRVKASGCSAGWPAPTRSSCSPSRRGGWRCPWRCRWGSPWPGWASARCTTGTTAAPRDPAREPAVRLHERPARRQLVPVAAQAQRPAPQLHQRERSRHGPRGGSAPALRPLAAAPRLPPIPVPLRVGPLRGLPAPLVARRRLRSSSPPVAWARAGFPRPGARDLAALLGGKAVFLGWAFAVPLVLHPWAERAPAHAARRSDAGGDAGGRVPARPLREEAEFHDAHHEPPAGDWAAHQVATTVDFARGNRLLGWYMAGSTTRSSTTSSPG